MKDKPLADELRELLWRRRLTDAERGRAAVRPEVRSALELDAHLTEILTQLPAASVPSNFTTRVLQAVELEEARSQANGRRWFLVRWLPRVAVTAAVLVFAGVAWQQHELVAQRTAMAHTLARVTEVSAVPGVEALNNFDAIQRMGQAQPPDEALLALMQ